MYPDAWLSTRWATVCGIIRPLKKSARRGLQLIPNIMCPNPNTAGITLVQKPDYEEAAQHLRAFLSLATKTADVEAKRQLDEIASPLQLRT